MFKLTNFKIELSTKSSFYLGIKRWPEKNPVLILMFNFNSKLYFKKALKADKALICWSKSTDVRSWNVILHFVVNSDASLQVTTKLYVALVGLHVIRISGALVRLTDSNWQILSITSLVKNIRWPHRRPCKRLWFFFNLTFGTSSRTDNILSAISELSKNRWFVQIGFYCFVGYPIKKVKWWRSLTNRKKTGEWWNVTTDFEILLT